MINISNTFLSLVDRCKPILLKVLPIKVLRKIKRLFIVKSYKSLEKLKIQPFKRNVYKDGINLIGNIRAEIGLGQSCRLIANMLNESNVDFSILNYVQVSALRMNDTTWDYKISNRALFNINIIHINPYELGIAYLKIKKDTWNYRYNIAFWLWELEEFPDEWTECIPYLDEIWTPSDFASESIRKKTDKPVLTIPYYVTAPVDKIYDRSYFRLPEDKFLFLIMYDSNSTMERKNPLGAIQAYMRAFGKENKDVGLVIKINNMQKKDMESIQKIMNDYENIYYITDVLQKSQVNSLIKCVDVYVSLHRAEGFGLVLAEAMLLGTPTISTNWSSTIEFMNEEIACLVDYELVEIKDECGPYKPGNRWAEPNIVCASKHMVRLFEDKEKYNSIVVKAKRHVENYLGKEKAIRLIEKRVAEIYDNR